MKIFFNSMENYNVKLYSTKIKQHTYLGHQIFFFSKSVQVTIFFFFCLIFKPDCEKQLKSMGEKNSKVYSFTRSLLIPGEICRNRNICHRGIYYGKIFYPFRDYQDSSQNFSTYYHPGTFHVMIVVCNAVDFLFLIVY